LRPRDSNAPPSSGNPCTDWAGCRAFVVAQLPQLKQLDGKLVSPTERIDARRQLPKLRAELEKLVDEEKEKKGIILACHLEFLATEGPAPEGAYTRESRIETYREQVILIN
jgi:protein TilB